MEYSIKPAGDLDYIGLTIVGDFTAADMMKCVVEAHRMGLELDIHGYLVDTRGARNVDSILGNYTFAYSSMRTTEGIDPLARVAALVSPGDHSHDFVELVSTNAGMSMKVFTDPDAAREYLAGR